jgi:hypothetical protein
MVLDAVRVIRGATVPPERPPAPDETSRPAFEVDVPEMPPDEDDGP